MPPEKIRSDNTRVAQPPVLNLSKVTPQLTMSDVRNNQLQYQANAAMYNTARRAQVEKAVKNYHKQVSDQTRKVTYANPVIQREQDRASLTPEQEMRRDQPQPKPNMAVEETIEHVVPYFFPYIGEVLMAKDFLKGVKDIHDNGLNWDNGIQTALSGVPLAGGYLAGSLRVPKALGNIERRGAESFMRTTIEPNPLPEAFHNISRMIRGEQGGVKRLAANLNYILTGVKRGPIGYSNSYAPYKQNGTILANSGFYPVRSKISPIVDGKNDMIDAYLYGKTIDPVYEVKKVEPDYGVHADYISKNYPDKDIPVYEMTEMTGTPSSEVTSTGKYVTRRDTYAKEINDNVTGNYSPNVAGHRVEEGYLPDGTQNIRMQDIWKFKPDEYEDVWGNIYKKVPDNAPLSKKVKAYLYNTISKIGLHEVDRLGTPVITRSKWIEPYSFWNFNTKQ